MSRWGHEWNETEVDAYIRDFKAKNNAADRAPDVEPHTRHANKKKVAAKEAHPRYRVQISYRANRTADPAGRSNKWAIDGLVQAGILGDDTWEWITEIKETEEKGKIEQTVIELYEIIDPEEE